MNRILIIILLLTAYTSKGQINDSVAYVYFHSSNDTIITVIKNSLYYSDDTYFSIEKITTSSQNRMGIKESYCCSKRNMNRKLDSISVLGYLKGINISDKCKDKYSLKQYKKRQWKKQEKVKYSVTDCRILEGKTLKYHKSRIREFQFNIEYSRESQISNILSQNLLSGTLLMVVFVIACLHIYTTNLMNTEKCPYYRERLLK